MAWVRVDDNAAFHGKIVHAGNEAVGVWIRCLAWCNSNLTDGVVPRHIALLIADQEQRPIDRLLAAGLFEVGGEGVFQIHDFADYQMSAAEVRAKRADITAKRSAAGKAGARARWQNGKRMATGSGLPMANHGKTAEPAKSRAAGEAGVSDNEKTRGYDSKTGKRMAKAKQTDSPIPSHPNLDIHDNARVEASRVEEMCAHLGRLGGNAFATLAQLSPLLGWEIKAALGTNPPNWGYFVKVVENTRTEGGKSKPPAAKKRQREPPQPPADFGRAEPSTEFGNGDQRL